MATPGSVRSRVWCYGLRNPFRITLKPGTGSTDPAAGDPGTLYIGDVGWGTWEETDVARTGGLNFGWPCYEGAPPRSQYQSASPSAHGCPTIGTSANPGTLAAPAAYWNHSSFIGTTPPGFYGDRSTGGAWYVGSSYPGSFKNRYFFEDYGRSRINIATVGSNDVITAVNPFGTGMDSPVCLRAEPATGELYCISIATGQVRHIRYTGPLVNTPVAIAAGTPLSGVAPLAVSFSSTDTYDPAGDPFTVSRVFGDGQGSTAADLSHTYAVPGRYEAILTADDGKGGIARDTLFVIALQSAAFPTTPVIDDYNRPDGPLAAPWVDPDFHLAGLGISSDALTQSCCSYPTPAWSAAGYSAAAPTRTGSSRPTATAPSSAAGTPAAGRTRASAVTSV